MRMNGHGDVQLLFWWRSIPLNFVDLRMILLWNSYDYIETKVNGLSTNAVH